MITRIWHGRTSAEKADEYLSYLLETGIADYVSIPGNISAKVLRNIEGEFCDFLTVTEWEDIDSIIKFAGDDYRKAKYYSKDKEYLIELEQYVNHYETFYPKT